MNFLFRKFGDINLLGEVLKSRLNRETRLFLYYFTVCNWPLLIYLLLNSEVFSTLLLFYGDYWDAEDFVSYED